MPVTSIAREPRGIETKHRANLSGAQGGNKAIEAGSLDGAACSTTEIVVDHFDISESASTFWRLWLSRFNRTCCGVDWRT